MSSATEYKLGKYSISTDKTKLNRPLVHTFLSQSSYWAQGRDYGTVAKSIEHSLCFGVYAAREQIGFARVVTDFATFAWLCDLFVLDAHRGQGLGKWLVECVTSYPDLRNVTRFVLATRDAHQLYRRHGKFETLSNADWWMARTSTG